MTEIKDYKDFRYAKMIDFFGLFISMIFLVISLLGIQQLIKYYPDFSGSLNVAMGSLLTIFFIAIIYFAAADTELDRKYPNFYIKLLVENRKKRD